MKGRHIAMVFAGIFAMDVALAADFKLTSVDIHPDKSLAQEFVYSGFGCTGGNQSPALKWTGVPAGTKSFAVALFDPDAMQGRGFWHWLVVNVPSNTTALPRDAGKNDGSKLPKGAVQIKNGFRATGYSGPCPPIGDEPHGYTITVYALKVEKLDIPADGTPISTLANIEANALGKTSMVYRYGRKP